MKLESEKAIEQNQGNKSWFLNETGIIGIDLKNHQKNNKYYKTTLHS